MRNTIIPQVSVVFTDSGTKRINKRIVPKKKVFLFSSMSVSFGYRIYPQEPHVAPLGALNHSLVEANR